MSRCADVGSICGVAVPQSPDVVTQPAFTDIEVVLSLHSFCTPRCGIGMAVELGVTVGVRLPGNPVLTTGRCSNLEI